MDSTVIINNEECRLIEGYERYHISISGRIYCTSAQNEKQRKHLKDGNLYIKEMSQNQRFRRGKYEPPRCNLTSDNNEYKMVLVAPLVLNAFNKLPKRFNTAKNPVIYIDGNVSNLHIDNLKASDTKGSNGKLSKSDIRSIKKLIKEGEISLKEISNQYDVSDMQISRIKTGENWGNGKRNIQAPKAPFPIENGKIRRFVALFNHEAIDPKIRKPFYIKRNPDKPTDNLIVGILKGYKLTHKHVNITRANTLVEMLNNYFFKSKTTEEPVFNNFYKSFE